MNCSIIFTNNDKNIIDDLDKYLCSDNKVHIRFKDFNKEEFLVGFEKKLTYLLSYLINYSFIPKLIYAYKNEEIIKGFLLQKDVLRIIDFLVTNIKTKVEGIQLKVNYKKDKDKYNYKYFGNINVKFFPSYVKNNLTELGDLDIFLETFNINLYDYLFNDNYVIWLCDKEFEIPNKFEKRKLKKLKTQTDIDNKIIKLW